MRIIPSQLTHILNEKNITQKELAEGINMSPTTISRYMSMPEYYEPSKKTIEKIANFLQVDKDDFTISKKFIQQKRETNINPEVIANIVEQAIEEAYKNNNIESIKKDTDLRIIQRARAKMNNKDKERMMNILKAAFEDAFEDIEE